MIIDIKYNCYLINVDNHYFMSSMMRFCVFCITVLLLMTSCSSSNSISHRSRKVRAKKTYVKTPKRNARGQEYHLRKQIIHDAKKHLGTRYTYGGKTPKGFDCSGFTSYVYRANGVELLGASHTQANAGVSIPRSAVKKGDLVFFGKGKVSHVGIVVDRTDTTWKVIHATSSRGVVVDDIENSSYWKSRYLFCRDIVSKAFVSGK